MIIQRRTRIQEILDQPHTHPDYYRTLDELDQLRAAEWREHNIATTAAFMMEGLRDNDYDALIAKWDQGCFEMVRELTSYAVFTSDLFETELAKENGSVPGMFDYEVTSSFGKWFGEHILNTGEAPAKLICETWIILHTKHFFNQGRLRA